MGEVHSCNVWGRRWPCGLWALNDSASVCIVSSNGGAGEAREVGVFRLHARHGQGLEKAQQSRGRNHHTSRMQECSFLRFLDAMPESFPIGETISSSFILSLH